MGEQNSEKSFELLFLEEQLVPSEYIDAARELLAAAVYGGFSAVYQEQGLPVLFVSKGSLERVKTGEYANGEQLLQAVHPADRTKLLDTLMNCGPDGYQMDYRAVGLDGSYFWVRDYARQVQNSSGRKVVLVLHVDISDTVSMQKKVEQEAQEFAEDNRILASITANAPCGICEIALDEGYTLLYANKSCYDFYGYTPEQLEREHGNRLIEAIWPDDLPYLEKTLRNALASGKRGFEMEHRILRRDGTVRWFFASGNFSVVNNKKSAYCVLTDTTARKTMEEQLRMNEERFRIALEQTDNTIFDYDIHTKRMLHGDKSAEQYGLSKWTDNVPESLVENGVVHPDGAADFLEMYRKIREGEAAASCIVQTKLVQGGYVWRKISMKTVFDGEGKAIRAVGFLEDIDDQKRREEALLELSERDALTGILNKGTTEARVARYLLEQPNDNGALMIMDIDNFKLVNDGHGHLFGDHVIAESARRLVNLFSDENIVGRIGGDEFIVFIKNFQSEDEIQEKARGICKAFQCPFDLDGEITDISCSIGIALFPKHGTAFETLYDQADTAMYEAKRHGKDQYCIYSVALK